jgi:hypothetical protein
MIRNVDIKKALANGLNALQGAAVQDTLISVADRATVLDLLPDIASLSKLRGNLAEGLVGQLSCHWIKEADLSEVFLTLSALWKYDSMKITGEYLASAIQRLVSCEVAVGGPYYSSAGGIQISANLQIASFVRLIAKSLPRVDTFLERVIDSNLEPIDPYQLYLLADLYECALAEGYCPTTLGYQAAALGAKARKRQDIQRDLAMICRAQHSDGFWRDDVFEKGYAEPGVVTTALIVRVLSDYLLYCEKRPVVAQHRHTEIAKAAKRKFDDFDEPLKSAAHQAIDKVCLIDRRSEITLLPYRFAKALDGTVRLEEWQYALLGVANVYAWVSYTIYDDFLDDEGDPAKLPVANCAMRNSIDCLEEAMFDCSDFRHYATDVFSGMDAANAWEIENCRFPIEGDIIVIGRLPKYGKCAALARRSFAHILGPMAVLEQYSRGTPSKKRNVESAFRHYLIARQMSDDMHDWYDDVQAGHISYVVAAILRDLQIQPGLYRLSEILPSMQKQFRRSTMKHVCRAALCHVARARVGFSNGEVRQTEGGVYSILDSLEATLQRTLDQYAKARAIAMVKIITK